MKDDPIVREVRRQRSAILESYGGDFDKMSRDVMTRQWHSGHRVVSRERRELEEGVAPNAYPFRASLGRHREDLG